MSGHNFVVPPLSWEAIGECADGVRSVFDLSDKPRFPIMRVIERILDHKLKLLHLQVGFPADMGDAEGLTCPSGTFIRLREDVYVKAWNGDGRARFTAAHELGHHVLHTGVPLARAELHERLPAFRLSEPQANHFAAELLMPRRFIVRADDARAVARRHGVSHAAAHHRLSYVRRDMDEEGPRLSPGSFRHFCVG